MCRSLSDSTSDMRTTGTPVQSDTTCRDVIFSDRIAARTTLLTPLFFERVQLFPQAVALVAQLHAALVVGFDPFQRADADHLLQFAAAPFPVLPEPLHFFGRLADLTIC